MDVVTGAFPPPFQWLFRAGWWFLKRIANRKQGGQHVEGEPDAGEVTFQVYQSMTDAMNDTPCIATGPAKSTNTVVTGWNITQVTPGNVGQPQATTAAPRMIGLDTTRPFYLARTDVVIGEKPIIGFNYNSDYGVPLNGFSIKDLTSEKKVHSYLTYELENPFFYQDAEIDPSTADVPTYPMLKKTASSFEPIGTVYATSGIKYSSDPEIKWQLALWKASKTVDVTRQPNSNVNLEFFTLQTTLTQTGQGYPTTTYSLKVIRSQNPAQEPVAVTSGRWYITVFTALGGRVEFTNYGAEYPFPTALYPGGERSYDPTPAVFHSGMALNTAVPLQFVFPREGITSVTLSMVHQMVQQALAEREIQDLPPPPPSEYDNLDMPPLEGDEEEEQGATGGHAPIERARQQRVRGPQCIPICGAEDTTPLLEETEEEDDEDYESDLDDDDYAEIPSLLKNLLTPEAKSLCDDLKRKGLDHEIAVKAAQTAFPHPAKNLWEASYHNALVDGLSPPSARDCAWSAISE